MPLDFCENNWKSTCACRFTENEDKKRQKVQKEKDEIGERIGPKVMEKRENNGKSASLSVKAVDQDVCFGVLIFKGEERSKFSSYGCLKIICDVGVLEFLQTEPDPYAALVFHPLEEESQGHHYKLRVTSNTGSWKAPGLCNVNTWLEASLDHDIVDLIVAVSSWAVPCPASRWFEWMMLNGDAFRRTVVNWLETGRHPMIAFTVSLWMRSPTPCSCLSSRPLKKSLWPSGVHVSPKYFQPTSQSQRMFHWYHFISCVSSSTFPAALSDLMFQVPIVILFLARSDFCPPVAYFSPPSWWPATEGTVLVPGNDQAGMDWVVVVIFMWCVLGNVAWQSPSLSMPDHSRCLPSRWLPLILNT